MIRNAPCGCCGATPPFPDGSRCHPHRILPGHRGGRYTKRNTTPRCPACHDIAHGGTGVPPFRGAPRKGGLNRMAQLTPEQRSEYARTIGANRDLGQLRKNARAMTRARLKAPPAQQRAWSQQGGRRAHEVHPDLARRMGLVGGRRVNELHPGHARRAGQISGRNYVNRTTAEQRSALASKANRAQGWEPKHRGGLRSLEVNPPAQRRIRSRAWWASMSSGEREMFVQLRSLVQQERRALRKDD